jgi:cytochrome c biogenesis protein CcmG, thiol:disulfide interchange protein DsbE
VRARPAAAVAAAVAVIGLLAFGLLSKGEAHLGVGEQVPEGPLPRLAEAGDGSLADYRGRWVLVNFWASWCTPCRDEAPALEEFQRRHRSPRFTVLGVDSRDLSADGRAFVAEFGLSYPQLRDRDGAAAEDWGLTGYPESFLVDPQGRLAVARRGPVDAEYLAEVVAPAIAGAGR